MLSIFGNIIGFITKVIPMLFAYRAGKKSAQVDMLENESKIVEKANEVERKIDRIHSVKPILVHEEDVLTPTTARNILTHNETWAEICSR
jgi:hypothetical protein